MRELRLPGGWTTLVDDEDYDNLAMFRWFVKVDKPGKRYVYRSTTVKGRRRTIYMHRAVTSAPAGVLVDHKNHDGLDNQKANLRVCNRSQNQANLIAVTNPNHPYKGVHRTNSTLWGARIECNGKQFHLGRFADPSDAARAYDKAALERWGEFALLNFPAAAGECLTAEAIQ